MNQKKQIEELQNIVKEQNQNIEHLKEAVLWINEPSHVRLSNLNKITNKQFNMAFPDNTDDEHYYSVVGDNDKCEEVVIEYVKESELEEMKAIMERSCHNIRYHKMTTFLSGVETYITTLMT